MKEQAKTREEGQNGTVTNDEQSQYSTDEVNVEDNTVTSVGKTKTQSAQSETTPTNQAENGDDKDIEENKFIAALSYLGILVLVPLLVKKDSKFSQFHAKQGLILLIIWVVGWIVFWVPIFGQILLLALIVLNIVAFIQALNGKRWEIPVISDWAKKINL